MDSGAATRNVIALDGGSVEEEPTALGGAEALFGVEASLLPETRRLAPRFKNAEWNNAYLHYMQRRLRRNPRDLKSHVRRIFMLHGQGRHEDCFGALVDLFLVLGKGGLALRRKLLQRLGDDLSPAQRVFLDEHLEEGLTPSAPLPEDATALLTNGLSGTTSIVVRRQALGGDSGADDPLQIARERITREPPDEESAQAILEGALMHDPGREDVCRELLALYRRNHLKTSFQRTYAALMGRHLALPSLWRETEEFFYRAC